MNIKFNDKDFLKRVDRAQMWGKVDKNEMRKMNRRVSKVYVNALRAKISEADMTITVKGKKPITPGTLRRSIGSWNSGRNSNVVLAGPRSRMMGRRVSDRADGWFANIVNEGALPEAFGGKRTNKYTGVFDDTLKQTRSAMASALRAEYKNRLNKYMR